MKMFDLQTYRKGYYNGYDITVNPTIANEFAAAAFRFGHSLVQRSLVRGDRNHQQLHSNVSLHEELTNPGNLYNIGSVDRLLLGLCMQPSQKRDEFITEQLTNHLFQTPRFHYGTDLAAINIQRGRDHGLAPYNAWREVCGLRQFSDWHDLLAVMSLGTLRKLQAVYRDVNDIDLFPGGMAERPVAGGLVGPTFACLIAQQFRNLRKGDRFWYENAGFESSFTPAQLQQLRKVTMARILCDNLDTIDTIQSFVFLMSDRDRNPYVSCDDILIPQFDLKPWTEQYKEQSNYNPLDESYPGAGYPSARPEDEAGELPSYPLRPGDGEQRPQSEQVEPEFLIDEDLINEENTASSSDSVVPSYLVDNDKLQPSKEPGHHYTTEGVEPSYLIDDAFQQSRPSNHHYTTEGIKPSYLINDKFQQSKPPNHHYTTEDTRPSYFIDDTFQHSKPPSHQYTTEDTNPSYLTDDRFQHHHKPHHSYTTELPSPTSRPSIIIIEDFVKPARPSGSKPAVEVITTRPQTSSSKPHSPDPDGPHVYKGDTDAHHSDVDTPIYIIIPGKEPGHQASIDHQSHGHGRPHKYHSTRPPSLAPGSSQVRPSHFYEEYVLNEPNERRTSTQSPNYYKGPQKQSSPFSHSSGYKPTSKPYSFIERYNEPSYYHHNGKKGQSTSYLKYVALWLPDENLQDTETSAQIDEDATTKYSVENESGDNLTTIYSDNDWGFNTADVEDDSKFPEMPPIAHDPQAVSEVPRPILLIDPEEYGSGDDCRSLA